MKEENQSGALILMNSVWMLVTCQFTVIFTPFCSPAGVTAAVFRWILWVG